MATLPPAELLEWLGRNQFLTGAQIDALRGSMASFPDSHALAKELIRRDWLTPFQVNHLLQGKHDQLIIDSYRLKERIGEGAMGQVFKAWQPKFDRTAAIKVILKELATSPKAVERFRREAEAAARLDHPNICKIFDAGEWEGRPFLAMDFIEGFNLSARVKQQGALPIAEAVEYTRQAALGLQHAHERGVIHRDIKPGNLLVAKAGAEGRPVVKILDFGLARFTGEVEEDSSRLTEVGKLLGTVDYIAPEQAHDARSVDIRADLYSLGCTLFYLLTARPPFLGDNIVEKLGPRLTGEAPWVRAVRPEVSPALEEVMRKLMARRPEDRYQTPVELAQALTALASPGATAVPVPMAMPVTSDAITPNVPLALPIGPRGMAADVSDPSEQGPQDPSFRGMTASGRDMSTGTAAARPVAPQARKAFPIRLVVIVGSVCLGLGLITCLICVLSSFVRDNTKKVNGSIVITRAYYANPNNEAKPGTNRVFVFIQRVDFSGPVKVTLRGLPEGVNVDPVVMPGNKDRVEVPFTVSFGTPPQKKKIAVHVEAESLGISTEHEMMLTVIDDPTRLKK